MAKTDRTNEPITEREILSLFRNTTLSRRVRGFSADGQEEMETEESDSESSNFTAQILMVYYVLQFQDVLLNNQKNTGIFTAIMLYISAENFLVYIYIINSL